MAHIIVRKTAPTLIKRLLSLAFGISGSVLTIVGAVRMFEQYKDGPTFDRFRYSGSAKGYIKAGTEKTADGSYAITLTYEVSGTNYEVKLPPWRDGEKQPPASGTLWPESVKYVPDSPGQSFVERPPNGGDSLLIAGIVLLVVWFVFSRITRKKRPQG